MKKYIYTISLLAASLCSCNKDKDENKPPVVAATPSTISYNISDSAYGTNTWVALDNPQPAIYEHYPYNKDENVYFDTGGSRKFCIVRQDTFDRYFTASNMQSYRVLGTSQSFYTYDTSYKGTPSIRISFKDNGFTLYSGVEMPYKTKSFVLTATKK